MIVTCPSCEAQYILPDNAVGSRGRRVKCTSCDYTWIQYPETEPATDAVEGAEINHDDMYDDAATSDFISHTRKEMGISSDLRPSHTAATLRLRARKIVVDGIVFALCALIATIVLLTSFSDKVVSRWPESARFYDLIGMSVPVPGQGIVIEDIKVATTATETENGEVAIAGKLVNKSGDFVRLPSLRVRAKGKNGWLKDWTIDLGGRILAKEAEATLDYVLQEAPAGTETITLIFVD